jgi:predicted transcriptional regulator
VSLLISNDRDESNSHRGRFDIIADILGASLGGCKKTHLMYHCNLSFKQLKSYLHFLLSQGFLVHVQRNGSTNESLEVTDKGRQFLRAYKGLMTLMQ